MLITLYYQSVKLYIVTLEPYFSKPQIIQVLNASLSRTSSLRKTCINYMLNENVF